MKKILLSMMAVAIAIAPLFAETKEEKQAYKNAKKEAKKVAKQIKKEGYKMVELGDLQSQLTNFLTKTNLGCHQVVGTAENCISKNLALTTARNNAANAYATEAGGLVKGRIVSTVSNIDNEQLDNITGAYERLILKEIKGELQQSIALIKENKKSGYDVKCYFLVDLDAAHQARKRAMELALEETKLAQEYGSAAASWIDEGLDKERSR